MTVGDKTLTLPFEWPIESTLWRGPPPPGQAGKHIVQMDWARRRVINKLNVDVARQHAYALSQAPGHPGPQDKIHTSGM